MKRSTRVDLATRTVEIIEQGSYRSVSGSDVDIRESVQICLRGTSLFLPEDLERMRQEAAGSPADTESAVVEVVNETTLSGIARLSAEGHGRVAVLNFASARNPGGGFLNGSEAQEESLARSSALHASQLTAWDFYQRHRDSPSLLYSDAMIWSPGCPVFRDDEGTLLDEPMYVDFITCAAPNAGAMFDNRPEELPAIAEVLRRRAEYILTLAEHQGCRKLILGAWGCGVFRNDPVMVARAFRGLLFDGGWRKRFDRVSFSVFDSSRSGSTLEAFRRSLA